MDRMGHAFPAAVPMTMWYSGSQTDRTWSACALHRTRLGRMLRLDREERGEGYGRNRCDYPLTTRSGDPRNRQDESSFPDARDHTMSITWRQGTTWSSSDRLQVGQGSVNRRRIEPAETFLADHNDG
jgi:hypothetical protein